MTAEFSMRQLCDLADVHEVLLDTAVTAATPAADYS
jgi:hypothetical protein